MDLIFLVLIVAMAAPLSWAIGFIADYQLSIHAERIRDNPAWIVLRNILKFAGFVLFLLVFTKIGEILNLSP